jgi:DNA-binding transcriptional LysR family regulator
MNEVDLSKIDINMLKALNVLIMERQVGRAAKQMNVSQSAMSHTLTRLRKVFDDPLFVRTAHGMEPNPKAIELGKNIQKILLQIDSLFETRTRKPSDFNKRFRIQTHGYIAATYLPGLISELRRSAPGIVFDIQTITPNCYELLEKDKSDMIIGAGLGADDSFSQALFVDDGLCCLMDENHPVLENWTTENIFNYPHVKLTLLEDHNDPVAVYGMNSGFGRRKIGLYTETLHVQTSLLSDTELIAFIPTTLAKQAAKIYGLKFKECPFDLPKLKIMGIWHQRYENDVLHKWIRKLFFQRNN